MTTEDKIKLVTECVNHIKAIDNKMGDLVKILGTDIGEAPVFRAMYGQIDSYIDMVAQLIGDDHECDHFKSALEWFIYECECGENPKEWIFLDNYGEDTEIVVDSPERLVYCITLADDLDEVENKKDDIDDIEDVDYGC